jgi:hypothetical protein
MFCSYSKINILHLIKIKLTRFKAAADKKACRHPVDAIIFSIIISMSSISKINPGGKASKDR